MSQRGALFWTVIAAAAAILTYLLFIPPVIGLADQGDFRKTIGRFGYGPQHSDGALNISFVERKYVPDPRFREINSEQISSEYLFVMAALLANKVISKDGKLDLLVVGVIHVLAFMAIFARLLIVTGTIRARVLVWIGALVILTDTGYAAYWNSFYAEPASVLFCLLLMTESIDMCQRGLVSSASMARWLLWAILFIFAKAQNAPVGFVLALFSLRLGWWGMNRPARYTSLISAAAIASAAVIVFLTVPQELKNAHAYDMVFQAILPESRNPSTDLRALGLDPKLRDRSRTGAWSPDTAFPAMEVSGEIGMVVTPMTVFRFYLSRPTRAWRHIQAMLPIAMSLRPEWCGNYEPSAGRAPAARTNAFTLWSAIHEHLLSRVAKFLLFVLPIPALIAAWRAIRGSISHRGIEFAGLLALCCLTSFLTAVFGDAWDNVKHLFLFNVLLDACLVSAAVFAWSAISTSTRTRNRSILARSAGI